jgi:pyruvate-ferredoxin/flavodoxin oxidoreductase
MGQGMRHQKAAVDSGQWLLYRYNPEKAARGENPLSLDSKPPKIPLEEYLYTENRFKMLTKIDPEVAKRLLKEAEEDAQRRRNLYEYLAARQMGQAAD